MGLSRPPTAASLLRDLARIVGSEAVSGVESDRLAHGHDRWTRDVLNARGGRPAATPDAVVWPSTAGEAAAILEYGARVGVPVVPYGMGLGRNGACRPTQGGVVLATGRWQGISDFDPEAGTVRVQAGASLPGLEQWLGRRGYTAHLDPVVEGSLGGALGLRGTGLPGGVWGSLEERVDSIHIATTDGAGRLSARPQPDFGAGRLLPGAEGSFGVVVDATLQIRPGPRAREVAAFRLRGWLRGVEAVRSLLQSGLRPDVVQLRDALEIAIGAGATSPGPERAGAALLELVVPAVPTWLPPGSTWARAAERLRRRAVRQTTSTVVGRAGALNQALKVLPDEAVLFLVFAGEPGSVREELEATKTLVEGQGGESLGSAPVESWWASRAQEGFREPQLYATGLYTDVIDATATWDRIGPLYREVKKALARDAIVTSRLTHAYHSGAALELAFMGVAGHPRRTTDAVERHAEAVQRGLVAVHEMGASIAHHRGVGEARAGAMGRELGPGGVRLLAALDRAFDPESIMNPGKLGVERFRPAGVGRASSEPSAWQPALTTAVGPRNVRREEGRLRLRPPDERALAAVLRVAHAHGLSFVSDQSSRARTTERTALDRQALFLELNHLDGIPRISQHSAFVEVEAGVSLARLEQVLGEHDLTLGPLHPAAVRSSVGRALARGHLRRRGLAFGSLDDLCLSLRAILPTGDAVETRRGPRPGAGPDLRAAFLGAGAPFGIITRASLLLSRRPRHATSLRFVFPGITGALTTMRGLLRAGLRPSAAKVWADTGTGHLGLDLVGSTRGLLEAQVATVAEAAKTWEGRGLEPSDPAPPAEAAFEGVIEARCRWTKAEAVHRALAAAVHDESWIDFLTPWEVTVIARAGGGARRAAAKAAAEGAGAWVDGRRSESSPIPSAVEARLIEHLDPSAVLG